MLSSNAKKEMAAHIIGFSGSRSGMTTSQQSAFRTYINMIAMYAFHHGDCVGADAEAHALVKSTQPKVRIFIHPPTDSALRARCKGAHLVCTPLPFLQRNHAIVDASELLFAAPKESQETLRSGTWATIRYARKCGTPLIVVLPDGTRLHE